MQTRAAIISGVTIILVVCIGVFSAFWKRAWPTASESKNPSLAELSQHQGSTASSSLSNFSFSYPTTTASLVKTVSWEGMACKGEAAVSFFENEKSGAAEVFLATSPSTPCMRFNPNAKLLADYGKGYRVGDFEEVIHSQQGVTINGIPMLRQIYSQGYWTDHGTGKLFDPIIESGVDHQVRYVFFDGSKFVVITGFRAELYIDQIARSVRLLR